MLVFKLCDNIAIFQKHDFQIFIVRCHQRRN